MWQNIFIACLLWTACSGVPADRSAVSRIALTVLADSIHCGGSVQRAAAEWIDRPDGLKRLPKRLAGPQIMHRYRWNPSIEGLLWIHMGTQPTGGYRLVLASPTAELRCGVATILIRWQAPAPGSFVTQALTSPCLLLKVPKAGVEGVIIKDQNGKTRFRIDLAESR